MYKINLKLSVKEDLKSIKEYIFRMSFSLETANKIYNEIMASILTLKVLPFMYPIYKYNIRVMTVRRKYRVFYHVNENSKEVTIQYIFWAEQDYHNLIH